MRSYLSILLLLMFSEVSLGSCFSFTNELKFTPVFARFKLAKLAFSANYAMIVINQTHLRKRTATEADFSAPLTQCIREVLVELVEAQVQVLDVLRQLLVLNEGFHDFYHALRWDLATKW